jgi:CubicO group peptidase (beta-lactamase class C family)
MRSIIGIALVALAAPLFAQSQASQPSRDALVQKLDSLAGAPVAEGRAVGIAVAVVKGNDTLLMKGYGKADAEWNVPMPADAMFEIGSVTKQFTAAAILQLRDEGKLSLDDDVTRWLPNFDTKGNKIPLRRLLDHTSGIKGITEIQEFGALAERHLPKDSALALIQRYPFDFTTGDAMIYNNSAFIILGHVIEKASGMSYEDYVEKKIFAPLGMTRSSYCNSNEVVERRAHGYQFIPPPQRVAGQAPMRRADMNVHIWPFSAGSLCSTTGDLVTWIRALHGGKVLSPKSYAEMTTPSKLNDGTPIRYGMGIAVGTDIRGLKEIGHGGAIDGFVSQTTWYPDAQMAVVVLINSAGPMSPAALGSELAGAVLPWTPWAPKTFAGDLTPWLGTYTGPSRGRPMTAVFTKAPDGGLLLSLNGSPARPVGYVSGSTFRPLQTNGYVMFKGNTVMVDQGGGLYVLKKQ